MKINKQTRINFLACVIGDGTIQKDGSAAITHCEAQKEYLEWKKNFLENSGVNCFDIKEFDNSGYVGYRMRIKKERYTKLYRNILYSKGYKDYYRTKLLKKLQPVHIAIWYMDDGGLSQKKRNGKIHANDLMLNTHTTKENNQILIDYFKETWGVSFTQAKNKNHYRLRCGTREARKFIDIVKPYVSQVKCMSHKLNIKPL